MKVWIITQKFCLDLIENDTSESRVMGVFSDEEKARNRLDELTKEDVHLDYYWHLREYEVEE